MSKENFSESNPLPTHSTLSRSPSLAQRPECLIACPLRQMMGSMGSESWTPANLEKCVESRPEGEKILWASSKQMRLR